MKKELNHINLMPSIILIALLFPFLGSLGFSVYTALGKLYYVILSSFCLLSLAYNLLIKKKLRMPNQFITITLLLSIPIILSFFYDINFNHIGLLATCFIVFLYFFNSDIQTKTISLIFQIFLIVFLIQIKIEDFYKMPSFNPNTYAFVAMMVFMGTFLNFNKENDKSYNFLFVIGNSIIAVYTSYIYFKSETELLAFCFFMISFFLLRKSLNNNKVFYVIFTIAVFFFTISFTGISYIAIKHEILSPSFITNRGEIWVKAYDIILNSNILSPNILLDHPHAHNGFLNFCLYYSPLSAIAFSLAFIYSLLKNHNPIRDNNTNFALYIMIMTFIFINSVESFITDFNDVYLFVLPLAILFRDIKLRENNTNEK